MTGKINGHLWKYLGILGAVVVQGVVIGIAYGLFAGATNTEIKELKADIREIKADIKGIEADVKEIRKTGVDDRYRRSDAEREHGTINKRIDKHVETTHDGGAR